MATLLKMDVLNHSSQEYNFKNNTSLNEFPSNLHHWFLVGLRQTTSKIIEKW